MKQTQSVNIIWLSVCVSADEKRRDRVKGGEGGEGIFEFKWYRTVLKLGNIGVTDTLCTPLDLPIFVYQL
jgi:hypothetical protein